MFVCEICERVSESGEACTNVVVETRAIEHPHREHVYWRPPKDGHKGKWDPDPGGPGVAIVREVRACRECAETTTGPANDSPGRTTHTGS